MLPGSVARAIRQTISTSGSRPGLAGSSTPRDAVTLDIESSMVTNCSPASVRMTSERATTGRMSASRPWTRWPRFNFVVIPTVRAAYDLSVSGDRTHEITAQSDEDLGLSALHRRNGLYRVMAILARRLEAEYVPYAVGIGLRRLFVDAHRPVSLDV